MLPPLIEKKLKAFLEKFESLIKTFQENVDIYREWKSWWCLLELLFVIM